MIHEARKREWLASLPDTVGIKHRAVLLVLLSHRSKEGRMDPSYPNIGKVLGISESTVYRLIKELKEMGIIEWKWRYNNSNIYTIPSLIDEKNDGTISGQNQKTLSRQNGNPLLRQNEPAWEDDAITSNPKTLSRQIPRVSRHKLTY